MTTESNQALYGTSSMVAPLTRVAMRKPGKALLNADSKKWHYAKDLNATKLAEQYQRFTDLVSGAGCEILWISDEDDGLADSVFTYDPSFMTPAGAIILKPGKSLREPEAQLHQAFYQDQNIPIIGILESPGKFEGGDCFWLDDITLAVGRGFRTNIEGVKQVRTILEPQGINVLDFDLPVYKGSEACLHLMSVVSPLAEKVALVYAPLMPTALYQLMQEMGYLLIEAPEDEFEASLGLNLNVLATAPKHCIAVDGFPKTQALMREAGCEVITFQADELCIPCEGGPTCMTRPILRQNNLQNSHKNSPQNS
ncbi:MAG: dimethylargininase [Saprospiraceae bacterium]|jgi:dimethylargininase